MSINEIVGALAPSLKILFNDSRRLKTGPMPSSASALLAKAIAETQGCTVVHVSDSMETLDTTHSDLTTLFPGEHDKHLYYPAADVNTPDASSGDADIFGLRTRVLSRLAEPPADQQKGIVLTTCVQALMQKTVSPKDIQKRQLVIEKGKDIPADELSSVLLDWSYDFTPKVSQKNEASVRGGIIDAWPPTETWPVRIELFGDTVDSIRSFNPETQVSISRLNKIVFSPASEFSQTISSNKSSLLAYLPPNTIILWSRYESTQDYAEMFEENCSESSVSESITAFNRMLSAIGRRKDLSQLFESTDIKHVPSSALPVFEHLARPIKREDLPHSNIEITHGRLSEGFQCHDLNITVVTESDFFSHRKIVDHSYYPDPSKDRPARKAGTRVYDFSSLEPGDLVVHNEYGLGKYRGLFEIVSNGRTQEVLTIEYANNAKLHVPVWHSNLLTRYVGSSGRSVRLHPLHGKKWAKAKERAEESIRDLAAALLETQAERNHLKGHAFKKDSQWQREFELSFPYVETPDQNSVIASVKEDMESTKPMDRLICGDAGYGKTEVAMRAAFKAVMENKQVAVLVPTTVLALQHFQTFSDRMSPFPVRVDMLSRFRSKGTQEKILSDLEEGKIDIIIGTHALLQQGISFKDLGLVIIDEEQRFGVAHKEHFKQLRKLVDVLTMTATPIPRTLYLSMTGARDISLLQSPPRERMSIRTIVSKSDDHIIREAILREISRGGQVFFLHNRVMTIEHTRQKLEEIVPEADIRIGHGQMPSSELAKVMEAFTAGEFNVLLSTTIIESGMDIPRANTILIDRADRFGIADLYQLRGRVGRSSRQAYAYLLTPPHGKLEFEARKRIDAVKKYSGLSAGFSLAIRDLEIRGAGNMLGSEQSGHIAAIGFNLYCQMLKREVARLKGETPPLIVDIQLAIDFLDFSANRLDPENAAALPYAYIEEEPVRIEIYRRFAELTDEEEIKHLETELQDRFGPIPAPVKRLLLLSDIRICAAQKGLTHIETQNGKLMMRAHDNYIKDNARFPVLKGTDADQKLSEILDIINSSRH
ncbi:transcription-repair coupling factor [bacterium E08(2017)]|nr:transcription-repair coupling factor [bacterium E08(2017)]